VEGTQSGEQLGFIKAESGAIGALEYGREDKVVALAVVVKFEDLIFVEV
jgi:hypothetical protein